MKVTNTIVKETRTPIAMEPGQPERFDCEYERNGVSNLFMMFEHDAARRHVTVTDHRTAIDGCVAQLKALVDVHYPNALKILVVQDQLNTHRAASLYKAFEPAEALRSFRNNIGQPLTTRLSVGTNLPSKEGCPMLSRKNVAPTDFGQVGVSLYSQACLLAQHGRD